MQIVIKKNNLISSASVTFESQKLSIRRSKRHSLSFAKSICDSCKFI